MRGLLACLTVVLAATVALMVTSIRSSEATLYDGYTAISCTIDNDNAAEGSVYQSGAKYFNDSTLESANINCDTFKDFYPTLTTLSYGLVVRVKDGSSSAATVDGLVGWLGTVDQSGTPTGGWTSCDVKHSSGSSGYQDLSWATTELWGSGKCFYSDDSGVGTIRVTLPVRETSPAVTFGFAGWKTN